MSPDQDGAADATSAPATSTGADDIAAGVADVVRAALGVGAALARSVTRTLETGEAEALQPATGPLGELVRDSLDAAGGVVRVIVRGIGVTRRAVAVPLGAVRQAPLATAAEVPQGPRVHAGSTLRVPLSIENPGPEPLKEMAVRCSRVARVEGGVPGEDAPSLLAGVRFEPQSLNIGPRDFEKLTVYVDVPAGTSPGSYRADLTDGGGFAASLEFEVVSET